MLVEGLDLIAIGIELFFRDYEIMRYDNFGMLLLRGVESRVIHHLE